ncbi:unnamed protein product, partial [Iphiclides podalirius]
MTSAVKTWTVVIYHPLGLFNYRDGSGAPPCRHRCATTFTSARRGDGRRFRRERSTGWLVGTHATYWLAVYASLASSSDFPDRVASTVFIGKYGGARELRRIVMAYFHVISTRSIVVFDHTRPVLADGLQAPFRDSEWYNEAITRKNKPRRRQPRPPGREKIPKTPGGFSCADMLSWQRGKTTKEAFKPRTGPRLFNQHEERRDATSQLTFADAPINLRTKIVRASITRIRHVVITIYTCLVPALRFVAGRCTTPRALRAESVGPALSITPLRTRFDFIMHLCFAVA